MSVKFNKTLIAALIAGMSAPMVAHASEADLLQKIEALAQQIEVLKSQVKANEAKAAQTPAVAAKSDTAVVEALSSKVRQLEAKSLGKWLSIGGDYRFRVDSLAGETKTFTDVNQLFANAQNTLQANFFADPTNPMNSAMLSGLMNFAQGMGGVQTVDQANAFLGANAAMLGGLSNFAVPVGAYKPKNATLYSNRFALDLNAKAAQDITVSARLQMYKLFGSQSDGPVNNAGSAPFFADRVGAFDGTLSHVPSNSYVNVDRVYATWSNIGDEPLWFSVGRRPSNGGAPSNLRENRPSPGNGGTPALLVDYAFDGMTVGYAPDIDALPGAYGKICYGRGFESGYSTAVGNSLKDTDMLGVALVPIDTDPLRVWLQWNRGMNIFDAPTMNNTYFGNTKAKANLGDIDWFGVGFMSTLKDVGPGKLNLYADLGVSVTHPNQNVSAQFGFQGLMTGAFFRPEAPASKTGTAVALGVRYDLHSNTKLGFEYNHGSKNWITFAPAADDMWTAKAGTRGNVYEAYLIQELGNKPISSYFSKAFFRLGVQYYDFQYTGSNNWVGAPVAIGDVNGDMMATTPLKNATNVYATFEVKF